MSGVLLGENRFLPRAWAESVARLRLGIAPVDLLGAAGGRLGTLDCFLEDVPLPFRPRRGRLGVEESLGLPRLRRSPSARHSLVFGPGRTPRERAVVRLVDRAGIFVPRRLSLPTPTLAQVEAEEDARRTDPNHPSAPRGCRPVLFPSVRYGTPAGATVVRGRATRAETGEPVGWGRVTVRPTGSVAPTWHGQTDGLGEFVVFVGTVPLQLAKVGTTLDLDVTLHTQPVPPPEGMVDALSGGVDPLKHLPVELVPALDAADPVLAGTQHPPGYLPHTTVQVTCRRGTATPTVPVVLA